MNQREILATFWTLAGPKRPGAHPSVSPWPATDRIRAAGRAGFRGFGFMDEDLAHWLEVEGATAIGQALTAVVITDGEIELKGAWWSDDEDLLARYAEHLAVAAGFGFTVAKVFAISSDPITDDECVRGLRRLGEVAANHGIRIGLEFVPSSMRGTGDSSGWRSSVNGNGDCRWTRPPASPSGRRRPPCVVDERHRSVPAC